MDKREFHTNADGVSRLSLPHSHEEKEDTVDVFYTSQWDTLPISSMDIKCTMSAPTLSRVLEMVNTGYFPKTKEAGDELSSFLMSA